MNTKYIFGKISLKNRKMKNIRKRQMLVGEVTSAKMDKTVTVKVVRKVKHPMYKKFVKHYKKYLSHVSTVNPKCGDLVQITAIRPLSKLKRWQVSKIIKESIKIG